MEMVSQELIKEVIENFCFEGKQCEQVPWGNGHINDTFLLSYEREEKVTRYILQRMNKNIFTQPVELMENVMNVTSYLRNIIIKNGAGSIINEYGIIENIPTESIYLWAALLMIIPMIPLLFGAKAYYKRVKKTAI